MVTTTNHRSAPKGVPSNASAGSPPDVVSASTDAGWERVKADYRAALVAREEAIAAHDETESAYLAHAKSAPTVTIAYQVEGFTSANGLVELKTHTTQVTLDRHNWDSDHLDAGLKSHPDYIAFRKQMEAWLDDPERLAAKREEGRTDEALGDACRVVYGTWDAVAAYPVTTARQAHAKIELLIQEADGDSEWLLKLLGGIQADLIRISAASR